MNRKKGILLIFSLLVLMSLFFIKISANTNDISPKNDEGIKNNSSKSISKKSDVHSIINNRYVIIDNKSMSF